MTAKKLHFGPLEPGRPFWTIYRTMNEADLAFYDGYDPKFIWKKVAALFGIYSNAISFRECAASWEWPVDSTDEGFLGAIATEIDCASFHQIEGLIALLLAEYQNRPDWVYLTSYANHEMKEAARSLAQGDFEKVTRGVHKTAGDFVQAAVYAGFAPEGGNREWARSVDDIGWLIAHCAEGFVDGNEYNAYKHGLRVVSGSATLAVRPMDSVAPPTTVLSMRHSLSYLEISKEQSGYTGQRVAKELNPEYGYDLVAIIANVLEALLASRVMRIRGKADFVPPLTLDRDKLLSKQACGRFSFSF